MKPIVMLVAAWILLSVALPAHADPAADARSTVAAWLSAQNDGRLDAYLALYGEGFVGVRRTSKGAVKRLDLAQWKADRGKMFKVDQLVAAEDVKVEARSDTVVVTFTQRWWGGGYADHGEKVLTLRQTPEGKLAIVGEELRSSKPGWGDEEVTNVVDATALASPIGLRVRRFSVEQSPYCERASYEVVLKDKSGREVKAQLHEHDTWNSDVTTSWEEPLGALFVFSDACATDVYNDFQIRRLGDALVVLASKRRDPREAQVWRTEAVIKLPVKATIKAR